MIAGVGRKEVLELTLASLESTAASVVGGGKDPRRDCFGQE